MRKVQLFAGLGAPWMISAHISLGPLLVGAGIAAIFLLRWRRVEVVKDTTLLRAIATLRREQDRARNEAIEEDSRRFLSTIQLPALEGETRLREAARRLRTVLVERIVHGR